MNKILTRLQNWRDYSAIHLKMLIFALCDLFCNPKAHNADVRGDKKKQAGVCFAGIWPQT